MDAWRLPRPRVIGRGELELLSAETSVYLRGPKDDTFFNRRCAVSDLLDPAVIGRLSSDERITVEISPDSVSGGAALLLDSELYIETVHGHVSSLLHAGQCSLRSYRTLANGETRHCKAHQEFMFAQSVSDGLVLHSVPRSPDTPYSAAETIANLLSNLREKEQLVDPIMFEWMWTAEGTPLFVDCKDIRRCQWHNGLVGIIEGDVGVIESTVSPSLIEVCMVRDYCSAFKEIWPPFHARVRSQALLSHFFTYTVSVPRLIEMV